MFKLFALKKYVGGLDCRNKSGNDNSRFWSSLLLNSVVVLVCLGLVMTYSSSALFASAQYNDSWFFAKRQFLFLIVAIMAFFIGYKFSPEFFRKHSYLMYLGCIMLLIIVLLPGVGKSAGGAARWIPIGPFRLQAGEIFKVALVFYLAMSLAKKGAKMAIFRIGIIPHLVLPGIAMVLLMLEPDFGTTFMVASVTFVMLFVGGAKIAYLVGAIFIAVPAAVHMIAHSPYRLSRVIAFLDPWSHRQDVGYQVVESLLTLGAGGPFGKGLGLGAGKLFYLPAAHTDFILAVIGEELGFIGIALVLVCFALISIAGLMIAREQTAHPFLSYLATGFTTMLVLQAIFNSFVVMGLAPTKGITLPFVSYGGSSLLVSCFMVGMLVQISQIKTKAKT